MGTGIWAIAYNLQDEGRQDYLAWFHEVHIPEKLSRPGYVWAAHFQAADDVASKFPKASYLALFGGETTRTFFDPSPGQLKQRQGELTRAMIGKRVGPVSCVYTVEWHVDQSGSCLCGRKGLPGRFIRVERFSEQAGDEEIEVWCAQGRAVLAGRGPGCLGSTKLIASMGSPRHALLLEFSDLESPEAGAFFSEIGEQSPYGVSGSPFTGKRIWPPL